MGYYLFLTKKYDEDTTWAHAAVGPREEKRGERECRASDWRAVVVPWLVARGRARDLKPARGWRCGILFYFLTFAERETWWRRREKEMREAEYRRRWSREDEEDNRLCFNFMLLSFTLVLVGEIFIFFLSLWCCFCLSLFS